MTRYRVFSRTWWKPNPTWPNGREPYAGKKRIIRRNLSQEEARTLCAHWTANHGDELMSLKAEYEEQ